MADISQAILQGIERLNQRFDGVDARLDRLEARFEKLELRVEKLEASVERLDGRVGKFETSVEQLKERMSKVEETGADINARLKSWPDLHFLAAAKIQIAFAQEMKDHIFVSKTRMDEIYRCMATDPEIGALREDVSQFRKQSIEMELRLSTVEGHLGLEPVRPSR